MQNNGMDFRRKEVINITDGKRLRICARCMCRFRDRKDNFYNSTGGNQQNIKLFFVK